MAPGGAGLAAPDRPVVSFTFDDFPKTALTGADIVEKDGGKAGFYACTSLMGQRSPVMGEMFDAATLAELRDARTMRSARIRTPMWTVREHR